MQRHERPVPEDSSLASGFLHGKVIQVLSEKQYILANQE